MKIGDNLNSMIMEGAHKFQAKLNDYKGRWLIIYFYPKDATPGCTQEGKNFRDYYPQFQALNAEIIGISRDSAVSHEKFKLKHEFPFELISDTDETICKIFEVLKNKSMFGNEFKGVERSTFIINPEGKLVYEWRKVKVNGHVESVLATLKQLQAQAKDS